MRNATVFAAVVLCASPAWALRFMGPPTTDIEVRQMGIGLDWTHSQFDIRYDDDWLLSPAAVESDMYFARILLGITDWAEISASIGVSDIDEPGSGHTFHSGNDFAWGVGAKLNFGKAGPVEFGAAFQLASLGADDRTLVIDPIMGDYFLKKEYNAYLLEFAVGPSYKEDGLCLYGGPFLHLITGEMEWWENGLKVTRMDIEEEESDLGGYVGISAEIVENTNVGLEYHLTDDSWAIGVGILHRFGVSRKTPVSPMTRSYNPWPTLPKKTPPKQDGPKVKLKTDASGEPVKDKAGNFIFAPVDENPQEK